MNVHLDVAHRKHILDKRFNHPFAHSLTPSDSSCTSYVPPKHHVGRDTHRLLPLLHRPYPTPTSPKTLKSSSYPSPTYVADHMLRRKTPNGTVAAGYDGTPIEWVNKRPASKQSLQLTTNSPADEVMYPRAPYEETSRSQAEIPRKTKLSVQNSIGRQYPTHRHGDTSYLIPGAEQTAKGINEDAFQNPGLDSVLYQGSPPHQPIPYASGKKGPMVMQPMWPPCMGITSLNDPEPYGPYWPNGAFVPYRPAPICDPRFPHGPQGPTINGTSLNPQLYFRDPSSRVQGHGPFLDASVTQCASSRLLSRPESLMSQKSSSSPSAHDRLREPAMQRSAEHPHLYNHQTLQTGSLNQVENREQALDTSHGEPPLDPSTIWSCLPSSSFIHSAKTNNMQFKERVLLWAHRVYMGLSSSRQHTQRVVPTVRYPDLRHLQENSWQPQSSSDSSRQANVQECNGGLHNPRHVNPSEVSCSHSPCHCRAWNELTWVPPQLDDANQYLKYTNGHHDFRHDRQTTMLYESSMLRSNRSSQRLESPSPMAMEILSCTTSTAVHAMELLSKLCQESDWTWTDGMLLGGCLAYGLGEYSKAFKWYSKVLSCDAE